MRGLGWAVVLGAAVLGLAVLVGREASSVLRQLDGAGGAAAPAVPCTITGRVHDTEGDAVPRATLTLVDTTGTTGTHFLAHARTVKLLADDAGVFTASLPFTPNRATVTGGHDYRTLEWVAVPSADAGAMEFVLAKLQWATIEAHVTDETGAPLEEVHLEPGGATTDDVGWARFELLQEEVPPTFRVRKMGFKPVNLARSELSSAVLRERRTLLRVSLIDASTRAPLQGRHKVSALVNGELVSFCTTDASTSACTLDADPGTKALELRVGQRSVKSVAVGSSLLEVVLDVD